ncbi:hypothetical protein Tco_1165726, partial [Tanacetum coccineum]
MSPPAHTSRAKYHWGIAFATGLKRFTDPVTKLRMKHTNCRVRIPKGLYLRRIESKMTKKQVGGKWILVREMTMISKDGEISKFEEPSEQPSLMICMDLLVTNNVNNANGGNGENGGNNRCTYKGFMACNPKEYDGKTGVIALTQWIEKMENVIDNSGCAKNQKVKYAASSFVNKALTWWNTQVQTRGREAAIVTPESSRIKRYIAGLAPEIRGMLRATQPTTIQSEILRAGILTDKAVSCGTLTKGNEKRKGVEKTSKQG